MTSRLILFDFDYTLFDASGCLFPALRKGLETVGRLKPPDEVLRPFIGIPLYKQFTVLTGIQDEKNYGIFEKAYAKERGLREIRGTNPFPGMIGALGALKKRGYQLGVVSTGARKRIVRVIAHHNALSYFGDDAIIGGANNKGEAIRWAVEHFRVRAQDSIYVGDRPDDYAASIDVGTSFIGVTTGAFRKDDFPEGCTVLSSVADLPKYLESIG